MSSRDPGTLKLITKYSAGTLEMGVSVAIGIGIGYWLDSVFDTSPWLLLLWLLAGVAAGFRSLYRVVKKLEQEEALRDRDGNNP